MLQLWQLLTSRDYNEAYGLCCGYPIEGWDKQGASGPGALVPQTAGCLAALALALAKNVFG